MWKILIRIPGIGPKLSSTIASTFGSLSSLFDSLHNVSKELDVHIPENQFLRSHNFPGMTEAGIRNICARFDI